MLQLSNKKGTTLGDPPELTSQVSPSQSAQQGETTSPGTSQHGLLSEPPDEDSPHIKEELVHYAPYCHLHCHS